MRPETGTIVHCEDGRVGLVVEVTARPDRREPAWFVRVLFEDGSGGLALQLMEEGD